MIRCCGFECVDPTQTPPEDAQSSYTVSYDSESHVAVLTQLWGSTYLKVLPYCLFNVSVMALLITINNNFDGYITIDVSTQGHTFMTLVVAFLLVSRVSTAVSRYMAARDSLGQMYRETRDIAQNMSVFSIKSLNRKAQEWRFEVTYRALILLRTSMAVIDYPTTRMPAWQVPELDGDELEDVKKSVFITPELRRYAHSHRSESEESMRVPLRIAYLLRKSIVSQGDRLSTPMQISQENRLLASVDGFMTGFYGIRQFLTTPVPFPLIQMARALLFLYVFTVPFVLVGDESNDFAHCFEVFMMTYGFISLELVAMELDNPFGDDPNDFSNLGMACTANEDVYLTFLDACGPEWTDKLRLRMHDSNKEVAHPTEQTFLLHNSAV